MKENLASDEESIRLRAESRDWPSIDLTDRQLCDLELLLNGGFSPLDGFLGKADYESVLESMRLGDGRLWPLPVMLDVAPELAESCPPDTWVALRDPEGAMLAALCVKESFDFDWLREAEAVFGTTDINHPGVQQLQRTQGRPYLSGTLIGIALPHHYDFQGLRHSPAELRREFSRLGWRGVTAFQTRNPLHRAHREMTLRAASQAGSHLLLNPVVGMTKPGDIDHYTRVRCYQAIAGHYPPGMMMLSLINLAMRMAGPREAVWHAIIRKNHGCTHFIVGRDHAGPGVDASGKPFYGPYEAQEMMERHQEELGITMLPFQEMVYVVGKAQYLPRDQVAEDQEVVAISGTELRRRLREGLDIPEWFSYSDVVAELRRSYPPKHSMGICIFFTGLSGAGKSTIAQVLLARFLEIGGRPVTLLDGDIVRLHLSSNLGFSKEDRDLNIMRIGFVANEITKNGGIAICAPIAPYTTTRRQVRSMIEEVGGFMEIHVATSLDVCEQRDRKGLYAKARAGVVKGVTGIDDPYETPENPEMSIDTESISAELAAQRVLVKMESMGFIR